MNSDKVPKVAVAVFILKGEKVLVGQRLAGAGTSCFSVPSGHLEFGEGFEECAAREVMEEAGLELKNIETLKVINHVFHNEAKPSHYVVLLIRAELSDPDQIPENVEPDRCESWDWYEWNHMPKPLTPPLQLILKSGFNPFSANVQN
nr:nudix hydrolase 1-like [Ipomoea batatas]